MSSTTANTIFGTFISDIGSVLSTNLPLIVGVLAGLIGLAIVIRYVKRWIGRK